ncbi:unnamed protein product [Toxocara canis]|nr:unnamed protein product [Toxocara canis]
MITSQRNIESDLRYQLSNAAAERKALQNELDDLRRRITNFETEKRGTQEKIAELTRIRITLVKRVEIVGFIFN